MITAPRRLWLYGLLLFLPALAVGGLALGLLAREQERLAEREQAARETRRAAVETRARLIAENIELLVGDVQSALMATLQEAPPEEPRPFLTEWQATNPLVREVFRATAEGRPVWGAAGAPLRGWLGQGAPWAEPSAPAPASGFERKAADRFAASTAPAAAPATPAESRQLMAKAASVSAAAEARAEISSNVGQYQRARQEIQEVAKLRGGSGYPAASLAPAAPAPSVALDSISPDGLVRRAAEESVSGAEVEVSFGEFSADAWQGGAVRVQDFAAEPAPPDSRRIASEFFAALPERLMRSGWSPWRDATGLHLFGWRELPDRTVVGLELRLDAIKARLGEVFPAVVEAGQGYTLRDEAGKAWQAVGEEAAPLVLELPLALSALPGWSVRAHDAGFQPSRANGGVFALGATLVGLLVLAILAAGVLLVRQVRLSEAEAAQKTSFVANVSHELKTPLTTIRLYAELLAQGRVRDEAKRADYLATIGQETQRLARLVGNVLDFSRLEQGKKKYEPAPVDLAAELRRLGRTHAPRLTAAGLELRVDAPGSLVASTDHDAVEQIVLNLLDNACKYAAGGGEVLLAAEAAACGGVRLVVADRGPGVPEGQRERVFEKFHRVDDRLAAEKGGAGLGLSIARQLARGLGGDLRCEGRPGGGAAFVLTLPV